MQQTSAAYKTEQKQHLRERSYVWVYLGVVDRTAQRTAKITSSVTDWSKPPTGNEELEGVYATYEQNFFRADGSMMFPPETWAMYQGAASSAIGGAIRFDFETACNIRGLSLKFFDDAIPLSFTVTNGTVTNTYTYDSDDVNEDDGKWSCEDEYANSTYIQITPITLKGGNQRFRIQQILFGKGFYFDDKDLLSTSYTNKVAHLSDSLPSKTFSFTISNANKKFSADDPHSFVHFLQEQQEVDFDYGRELPNGDIEKIKGGRVYLKTWSTDDQKATFNAVGYLEFMDSTYYKGSVYTGTMAFFISLKDYAETVFDDAGITNYSIDESLDSYWVSAPLPVDKHKNLLQLIANAGRCIFYEDRDGTFTISPAYTGTVENATNYTLEYKDLLSTPNATTTEFIKNVICNYYNPNWDRGGTEQIGTVEATDGSNLFILSDPVIIDDVCYPDRPTTISGVVDSDIEVEAGDSITFEMEWGWWTDDYSVHEIDPYDYRFRNVDKYTMEIVEHNGQTVYKRVTDTNSITWENTDILSKSIDIRCSYDWYESATNIESGSYYVQFNATRVSEDESLKMLLFGRKITFDESFVSDSIIGRNIGVDRTCHNILINNADWAEDNLDWMIDHYDDDVEYTLDYRGEPALDCDDVIYLENNYVAKNVIRVTEMTINTSQGMSKCTLKARRASWKDFARVDYAIVDDSEVK